MPFPDLAAPAPLIEPTAPSVSLDTRHFRNTLSQFATGVAVITTITPAGDFLGLTATSFNSVSLTPPLVLWSLGRHGSSLVAFSACNYYVINVLAADQAWLASRFASKLTDRFEGVPYTLSATGMPILQGAVAWFECSNRSRYPEGDHVIFVGETMHCALAPRPPLIFHGGEFVSTAALPSGADRSV